MVKYSKPYSLEILVTHFLCSQEKLDLTQLTWVAREKVEMCRMSPGKRLIHAYKYYKTCEWIEFAEEMFEKDGLQQDKNEVLIYFAEIGNINRVMKILATLPGDFSLYALTGAARGGHLHIIKAIQKIGRSAPNEMILEATLYNNLHIVRHIFQENPMYPPHMISMCIVEASKRGYIPILLECIGVGKLAGQLAGCYPSNIPWAFEEAAKYGQLDVLYILEEEYKISFKTIIRAIFLSKENNHNHVVNYLQSKYADHLGN